MTLEPAGIIREWSRRRRILTRVHQACGLGVLAVLAGAQAMQAAGGAYVPWWARIAVAAGLIAADVIVVHRLCRCPSCGQYPGVRTASGQPTRMEPFGWAVCLKCLVALRD
jgi:hypothetical protein